MTFTGMFFETGTSKFCELETGREYGLCWTFFDSTGVGIKGCVCGKDGGGIFCKSGKVGGRGCCRGLFCSSIILFNSA
ncbi:MAG: hypothetical protein COW47_02400 [Candidatus Huberarchaeum crystalense]|uniref:Uncharacterized protein n=1 Tax=Huberarchaeum crystalense TaxID=2014257 RepID=A0A2G9LIW4_HUBC1|nr:MAG: hypothetical protein COW69_02060 [Candidatus Huberarchaeum crystalense]PIV13845.1 MAG: hypothetical protein COS45_00730 [Candidatus Huberarchaeum crystalense]PIV46334.1 MAG: hypothetical protein COS22_02005 [Candidatus Huberarchaeum crystalense]PIV89560.1 MAG: hypothetical protein COW47_02400 [Candidatus Huberarchaeum crystalense]PIX28134.1 MAG: hypothetical protein COZ66_01105 [Candidatus Huberarchaeum crystalense]